MGDLIFTLGQSIHGVEVYNSRVGEVQNDFALEAASFLGLPTAGGSDPKGDAQAVGRYATFFMGEITTQEDFVAALRAKEFWAVQLGDVQVTRSTRSSDPFAKRRGGDRRGGGRDGGRSGGGGRSSGGRSGGRDGGGRDGGGRGPQRRRLRRTLPLARQEELAK